MSKFEKKDDDEHYMPFQGLEKGLVLQEKRIFNDSPINPRKCTALITKLLWLLAQGDRFTKTEATDVFFAVTKLFQSKDVPLRRMMFLMLKELSSLADDVIIVTSSLTKDMNSKNDLYRANAIRVLARITDSSLLPQIERFLKQAIVDKDPHVASAALVSGIHLMNTSGDIVKRWVSEVQEALNSKHTMVQYHALALMYQIKKLDRLAISKLVSSMIKASIRSPFAHCLLIRFVLEVMEDGTMSSEYKTLFEYLESCLRNKNDMVVYEAARAMCGLKHVFSRDIAPAIAVLQLFLSSPKATLRFAAVRTLNKVAMTLPHAVTSCNLDMDNLITDSNRSIATLAITTLLKTGNESSVERLMKQINNFMSEISDEFKVVVVEAILSLCLKFPSKYRLLLVFLSNILRDEGGFDYKKSIVEAILSIINTIPEAKEIGLTHLCEFIEDCEFTYLSTKILNLLGKMGPTTHVPSKYIRYIYNRVLLENPYVRASAVSALARFGAKLPHMRPNIIVLLRRCLYDTDDEVRDRAAFFLKALENPDPETVTRLILDDFKIPLTNLEISVQDYLRSPSDTPFDLSSVSTTEIQKPRETTSTGPVKWGSQPPPSNTTVTSPVAGASSSDGQSKYAALLAEEPKLAHLGKLFKSSAPVELTESETEYVVNCVKHIFPTHIVFQFNCTNTLEDQVLENAFVQLQVPAGSDLKIETHIPAALLQNGVPGVTYVSVKRTSDLPATGTFSCVLKFVMKELEGGTPSETGYDDSYQLEDIELTTADYISRTLTNTFQDDWNSLGEENEVVETFNLSTMKTLQDAVKEIVQYLGMQPSDNTDIVPAKKTKHILYLSGKYVGDISVLARARMKTSEGGQGGVDMELTVRSPDREISQAIASAI